MDSDTGGGRSKHDFSDIMSILGDEDKKPEVAVKHETAVVKRPEPPKDPRDSPFVQKLLADIERKNAEILKLNTDNMSLKYSLSEKDMELKRLQGQSDSRSGQVESLKAQINSLNRQIEDMNKFVNDARAKLGEMDADRAKLTARIIKEEEAPPVEEEDVASIFKRIAQKAQEPENGTPDNGTEPQQPVKKLKTAKLYDL